MMAKRAKRILRLGLVLAALLALSGCGGQTAEGLAKRVARAAAKVQITQTTVTSGIVLDLAGQAGQAAPSEAGIRTVMAMQLSADPKLSYAETDVVIEEGGWAVSDLRETWLQPDGEALATFARTGSTGQWVRAAAEPAGAGGFALLAELDPARLTLLPERQEVNGAETDLLSARLSGRELAAMLGGVAELQQALGELNWRDAAAIDTTFYIDVKTRLPVRIELVQENAAMPGGLTGRLLGEAGLDAGAGSWLHVYYDEIGYEPIEPPALPAEGLSSALTEEQLARSGAQYVIQENGQQAYLRLTDDWRVYAHAADEASVIRSDGMVTATYVMYTPDADSDFFRSMIEEDEIAAQQAAGAYVAHGSGPRLGDFETLWVECTDRTLYFAWGKAGNACLYLSAAEQQAGAPDDQHLSSLLRELIGMVTI